MSSSEVPASPEPQVKEEELLPPSGVSSRVGVGVGCGGKTSMQAAGEGGRCDGGSWGAPGRRGCISVTGKGTPRGAEQRKKRQNCKIVLGK